MNKHRPRQLPGLFYCALRRNILAGSFGIFLEILVPDMKKFVIGENYELVYLGQPL
ncbi:MAG TPA: hypothetical protein PKC40_07910 [Saprospiraceae bacterium]|nr:hypothetical protein [Saprospiraceae bacterium]